MLREQFRESTNLYSARARLESFPDVLVDKWSTVNARPPFLKLDSLLSLVSLQEIST